MHIQPIYTHHEPETPILWPPDVKNWFVGKDSDAWKYWRQEEKGMTEDEMVGWHHRLNGHGFQQTLGVRDGQGSLVCCSPWTWLSDWTELNWTHPCISPMKSLYQCGIEYSIFHIWNKIFQTCNMFSYKRKNSSRYYSNYKIA